VNDIDNPLMHCFATVFPGASCEDINTFKFEALPGWDSLRGVTLLALLDDEFGVQLDLTELMELETFDALEKHINKTR
jgi:acyl carrier protein